MTQTGRKKSSLLACFLQAFPSIANSGVGVNLHILPMFHIFGSLVSFLLLRLGSTNVTNPLFKKSLYLSSIEVNAKRGNIAERADQWSATMVPICMSPLPEIPSGFAVRGATHRQFSGVRSRRLHQAEARYFVREIHIQWRRPTRPGAGGKVPCQIPGRLGTYMGGWVVAFMCTMGQNRKKNTEKTAI